MELTLLGGKLPDTIEIGGRTFKIHTDFRNWVQLEVQLFDESNSFLRKVPELLKLCYVTLPDTLREAIDGMVSFYTGPVRQNVGRGGKAARPSYSFWQDEELIYAAFYQQYGIDLTSAALHWWQFKALLLGLGEGTPLYKVIQYRRMDTSHIQNAEERRFYRRMKELYKLCDNRSETEKEQAAAEALASLF